MGLKGRKLHHTNWYTTKEISEGSLAEDDLLELIFPGNKVVLKLRTFQFTNGVYVYK